MQRTDNPIKSRCGAALLIFWYAFSSTWPPGAFAQSMPPSLETHLLRDRVIPGDTISISLLPGEEYNRQITVQPDGKIAMPLIGTLSVSGMTVPELESALKKAYSKFLDRPQVTVNVQTFTGRKVAILGEVKMPGYYDYQEGMSLLTLISLAQGLTQDAKASRVQVLRHTQDANKSFRVNFKAVLEGDPARDVRLAPGDTVYVPLKQFTRSADWVNSHVLPWAILVTMITSIIVYLRSPPITKRF